MQLAFLLMCACPCAGPIILRHSISVRPRDEGGKVTADDGFCSSATCPLLQPLQSASDHHGGPGPHGDPSQAPPRTSPAYFPGNILLCVPSIEPLCVRLVLVTVPWDMYPWQPVSQHVVEVCGWRSTTAKHPPLINRSFSSSTRQGPSCCAGLVGSRRHHCPPQATPSCVLSGAFTSSPGVTGRPLLGLCMISEGYYSTPSTCFFPPGSCSCFSYMYEFVARFCCRVWWCLHLAPTPTRCCLPCIIVSSRVPVVQIRIRARLGSDQRVLPARLPLLRVYIWLLLLACMSRPALQCVCQTCRHLHRPLWPRLNPLLVDGARVSVHGGVAKRCPPPLPCDFSAAIPELQQCY